MPPLVTTAWILRSARRYSANPTVRTASAFANGQGVADPVHRSQVSRWESDATTPWLDLVHRYERVCGYPPGQLVAAVDVVNREAQPVSWVPALRRTVPDDPAQTAADLVQRAVADEPMDGVEWDRLSWLLGVLPNVLLLPDQWRYVLSRGLREMSVSLGLGYLQRIEAMARLMSHPRIGGHAVGLIEDVLTDPTSPVYGEAASLLQFTGHPDVAPMLLRVIRKPVNPQALWASLFSAAAEVRAERMEPTTALDIANAAVECCHDPELPYQVRRSAADLLLVLNAEARGRLAARLHRHTRDSAVASLVQGNGPRPAHVVQTLRTRIRQRLHGIGAPIEEDGCLSRLVDSITDETNDQRRADALELMMVLPFGPMVAQAYVEDLRAAVETNDALGAHESLSVLTFLPPQAEVDLITQLAIRTESTVNDDEVAMMAASVLGNMNSDGADVAASHTQVHNAVRACLDGATPATDGLYRAWAYALGMHRRHDLLRRLEPPADGGSPAWREARQWWLDLPTHLAHAAAGR